MIVSYRDKDAERLSRGMRIPRYRAFERQALRKCANWKSLETSMTCVFLLAIILRP